MSFDGSKHIIVANVDNKPGVVSRISGLFTRRGYNIESFVTSVTADSAVYQLTVSLIGGAEEAKLLSRQLATIAEVIDVGITDENESILRESMYIKMTDTEKNRELAEKAGMRFVSQSDSILVCELTETPDKIDAAAAMFGEADIISLLRSGITAIRK